MSEILHYGNGAEGSHDTADSEGVGNGLTETVLLGNLKVGDGAGIVAADLNGVDHEGRTRKCCLAVFNTEVTLDLAAAALSLADSLKQNSAFLKTCAVDVVESENAVLKGLGAHTVTDNVSCEYGASRTHKGYLHR